MLFGLCFFHASIQELHFAYLCILFVTFEYIAFATSSLGTSLYSTSFLIPSALAIPSVSFFPLCYIQGFLLISTTHVLNVCSWPFSAQHRRPELIVMSGTLHIWPSGLEHSVSPSCVYFYKWRHCVSIINFDWYRLKTACKELQRYIYIYRCQGSLQGSLCGSPPGTNSLSQTDRFVWCSSGHCGNFECAEYSPHVKSGAARHISSVCDYFFEPKPLSCEDVSGRKRCGSICSIEIHCGRGA